MLPKRSVQRSLKVLREALDRRPGDNPERLKNKRPSPTTYTVLRRSQPLRARPSATASTVTPTDKEAIEAAAVHLRKFHEYLREHISQRRSEPRQDLLSGLVAAQIEGKRLSDQEIVGFATTLLLAGHITTTALLGNTILCLDEHPYTQEALRANPAAIPVAIEEVLRYS